ncbi:MAG: ATP-binding protein [Blastocatellia bacterium]
MSSLKRTPTLRYGIALVAVVAPLLVTFLVRQGGFSLNPTWLIILALVLATWYGGRWPGVLAAFLFSLALNYFFTQPVLTFKINMGEINRFGVLAVLSLLTSARRQAEDRLKERARQQQAVARLGERALVNRDFQALLADAVRLIRETIEVEFCAMLQLQPDGQRLRAAALAGWTADPHEQAGAATGTSSQAGYTLLTSEPVIVRDARTETRFSIPATFSEYRIRSGLSVIIPGLTQPFGVLAAHTIRRRAFTRDDITFMQSFAHIIAEAQRRWQAEAQVAESRQRLQVTLASIGDAVIATDEAGRVTLLNGIAQKLTGWQEADAHGRPLREVFHIINEKSRQGVESPVDRVIREGTIVGLANHTLLVGRDGQERPVEDSGAPIRAADGKLLGVVLVFRDVTERRRAEQEREDLLQREQAARAAAEEASRLKDEFLTTVSHELRTPLHSILGWVTMLRGGKLGATVAAEALSTIERNARAQARIIEDILDVSRIITGRMRINLLSTELAPIIEMAIETVRPAAEARGIQLQTRLDADAGPATADPERMQQVVWNLLSNAVKFTPRDGRIEVQLRRADGQVELIVSDTGQGISPEFLPHVFDRFRQADSSSTRLHGGLGLGLSIVKHLIDLHGGSVSVESPGAGLGATFTVRLPAGQNRQPVSSDIPASSSVSPASGAPDLTGVSVLVVDDEADAVEMLSVMLRQYGAEVSGASSVTEALAVMLRAAPDALVADIGMPGEDGYYLIRKIRERGLRIPALALTAYARSEDRQRALAAGYQMHVPKPVEMVELAMAVASLTGRTGRESFSAPAPTC